MAPRERADKHAGAPFPESGDIRTSHPRDGPKALHAGRKERRHQAGDSPGKLTFEKMGRTDPKASPTRGSFPATVKTKSEDARRDPHPAMCGVTAVLPCNTQAQGRAGRRSKSNFPCGDWLETGPTMQRRGLAAALQKQPYNA